MLVAFNQEKALVGASSVIVQLRRLIVYSTSHHTLFCVWCHLDLAADGGREFEPLQEAAAALHAGVVVGVAVGRVAAHVAPAVAAARAARAVALALHAAADQREAVGVQDGVDRLE